MGTSTLTPGREAAPTLLRLATAGSVDDGKSTLIGRLLHDTKSVLADQLAAVEDASRRRGWTGELADLALLTDGLRAEREQGITIDVAYRYFATAERSYVLADTPGHVEYTRNMVTGASTADVVVVLVDARHGVLEQTRRHLALAALLRVPHVIVALNKIDLVEDPRQVYADVSSQLLPVAEALSVPVPAVVPLSALHGDNVVRTSAATPWYQGPSLLELLESLPPGRDLPRDRFRMPVQLVIRPQQGARDAAHVDYRGYAGLITSGAVAVGDEVVVAASGRTTTVAGIDLGAETVSRAESGLSVTLRLADEVDVSRGDLLGSGVVPTPVQTTSAVLAWLSPAPLREGARVLVKHGTRTVHALVTAIHERLDIARLTQVPTTSADLNDLVRVDLQFAEPLPVESYSSSRDGGAFIVLDPQDATTLAAGMVEVPGRE
ncbi:sulfate adenylyltransferase subunit 1 [Brachybacterium sacelli]|uniref:sulfate adenylyltransferase n=1 Tax=Brachybacterium sacelli TaxID=173364 RepID=A0ABS4X607_9MICO|nr:GTP-binding protein [Brachybacterium sacelli]MBP2383900.1 sulfate adenylyltransferase subunit 1 [Brachybacterium sacelli]